MIRCRVLWVLTILFAAMPLATASAEEDVQYRLGSGDELRVTVFGHEDLSGEFTLDGSGTVSLPLIGLVQAQGQTLRALEQRIEDKLQPDYLKHPRVSVQVLNFRPFYIIGEVANPGSYPYVEGMTVVNAVALAGGYTYRARENDVVLTRGNVPGGEGIPANHTTPVLPGDLIEVPERFF